MKIKTIESGVLTVAVYTIQDMRLLYFKIPMELLLEQMLII